MGQTTAKRITFIALMAALASLGSLMTIFLPNFSMILAFFLLITTFSGFSTASLVMIITILISNLRTGGIGPWTIFQLISYLLILGLWQLFLTSHFSNRVTLQVSIAALLGFSFGFWNAIMTVLFYHLPHFGIYYAQGLYFDLSLCVATGIFYGLFQHSLLPLLNRKIPELAKGR
ncbi:hypothetical protein FC15_GL000738 [Lapidilactobacillus concavus DSM 17758]|uniref:ECF transporter S component n=1 Tax=Lapidilactobacillus concavus DSM 17758 TaxID=1423735 RepID=A0A0R1VW05_9LACO|nr:hypothetical protein [Lapidilactobacillus concavus]KRM08059.1 hypothetical protein FC15_GL000738 [Lapidilactobacillus concavus DSM 17758]GEL12939.1 membrane protein [Lapidilactobacillus concavus]